MNKVLVDTVYNLKERLTLGKRQQFILVTVIMTLLLVGTQIFSGTLRWELVFVLSGVAYILSAISLKEGLSRSDLLTLLTLPTFFTGAVFLFYYLLPIRWLTRLPIALLYAVGMYAILLSSNIYNVATDRNIQLLLAARIVGFLITLVSLFFLIETVLSLHLLYYYNVFFGVLIVFPLALQSLWAMELTEYISKKVWQGALIISLIIGQLLFVFSFWPVKVTIEALFITAVFYGLTGMIQQYLIERLFANTIREFVSVLLFVFLILMLMVFWTTRWGSGL